MHIVFSMTSVCDPKLNGTKEKGEGAGRGGDGAGRGGCGGSVSISVGRGLTVLFPVSLTARA